MTNNYWKTVNENGGGYVKRAPAARSKSQVECELFGVKTDLASAITNAAYKNNEDGTGYKVERLQKRVAELSAELAA